MYDLAIVVSLDTVPAVDQNVTEYSFPGIRLSASVKGLLFTICTATWPRICTLYTSPCGFLVDLFQEIVSLVLGLLVAGRTETEVGKGSVEWTKK